MINEKVLNPATTNGFVFKKPIDLVMAEKIVLKIEADHNDGDYLTEFTDIDVTKVNLDLFFKVINVLRKLVQAKVYQGNEDSWHIIDLYNKLTENDIKNLYNFDKEMYSEKKPDFIDDIEKYSIMDCSSWDDISTIRGWFPWEDTLDMDNSDNINSNHSLISVTMQYHDGSGNIFNIEDNQ